MRFGEIRLLRVNVTMSIPDHYFASPERTAPPVLLSLLVLTLFSVGCGTGRVSPEVSEAFWGLESGGLFLETHEEECHVHHIPTVEMIVPSYGGLCSQPSSKYVRARLRLFPNSYWHVQSCSCVDPTLPAIRWVCPACRAAERTWRSLHGWSTEREEGYE